MKIVIIGGGYLGQLLHTLMPEAQVLDWRPAKPSEPARSFGPQYLWTPIRNLKCDRFDVVTRVDDLPATPERILAYKKKVGKEQDQSDWRPQFREHMMGYEAHLPEPDFVQFGVRVTGIDRVRKRIRTLEGLETSYDWIISTIPLPTLISLCGMPIPKEPFVQRPIYVSVEDVAVPPQYMYVNYISDPSTPVYRRTIRNGMLHSESLEPVPGSRKLMPGKIYANPMTWHYLAELRASKIIGAGRYGEWNPEELAHETYAKIQEWKEIVG